MTSKLDYIKGLNFFSSLDNEKMSIIANISNITKRSKNSILYYENDSYGKLFFLVSGLLKVYKIDKFENEIFLYHIYADNLISELTSLDHDTIYCFSNAEFMEDSIILEVNYQDFKDNFLSKNILNSEFIYEILAKTQQLHCVVNRELVFDATAKVAFMLNDDLKMFNSLRRNEVSFMLHIQPETLSRVLKKLTRSEVIQISNSKVTILDTNALRAIYQ